MNLATHHVGMIRNKYLKFKEDTLRNKEVRVKNNIF